MRCSRRRVVCAAHSFHYWKASSDESNFKMADQNVVSVVALEISEGKESEFLSLSGQMQALVRRKGYGTNQLLRDGAHPRRYYDIRIWKNADVAAQAESD